VDEATPVVETETESVSSVVGSHNPADLDEIIGSKPDLEALAKLAKRISLIQHLFLI
jgi:hypothetical protein